MRPSRLLARATRLLLILALSGGLGNVAAAETATDTTLVSLRPVAVSGNGGADPCPVEVEFEVKVFGTTPDFVNPTYGDIDLYIDGSLTATQPLDPDMNGTTFEISFAVAGMYTMYAEYGDGPDFAGSTSPEILQTIICASGPPPPASLALSPLSAENPVGTPHTVTATVRTIAGDPVAGVTVRFSVSVSNTASGASATNTSGQATFTYTGTTVGSDTIDTFADTDGNGVKNNGEPSGTATKVWTCVLPTLRINNVTEPEGTDTTTPFAFHVAVVGSMCEDISFTYETVNGTAIAPDDYEPIAPWTGMIPLSDPPGGFDITVNVVADADVEPTETFTVLLTGVTGALPSTLFGTGTILNDDGPPPPGSAREQKEKALETLESMTPSGNKHDDKKLEEAIKKLEQSLAPELWVDGDHVDPKHGGKVFDLEKQSVKKLEQLIKDKKSTLDKPMLQSAIDDMVRADRQLAETAIVEATGEGREKDLGKANEELAKGDAAYAEGDPDKAITHYKHAWKKAQHSTR